jgi:hypothetical protein
MRKGIRKDSRVRFTWPAPVLGHGVIDGVRMYMEPRRRPEDPVTEGTTGTVLGTRQRTTLHPDGIVFVMLDGSGGVVAVARGTMVQIDEHGAVVSHG